MHASFNLENWSGYIVHEGKRKNGIFINKVKRKRNFKKILIVWPSKV